MTRLSTRPTSQYSKQWTDFAAPVNWMTSLSVCSNGAWLRFLTRERTGSESAPSDRDEAWEIAERGPMRLQMADIHLYRARLFRREAHYRWDSVQADVAAARQLIEPCGYWRRKEELEDAERALLPGGKN